MTHSQLKQVIHAFSVVDRPESRFVVPRPLQMLDPVNPEILFEVDVCLKLQLAPCYFRQSDPGWVISLKTHDHKGQHVMRRPRLITPTPESERQSKVTGHLQVTEADLIITGSVL